MDSSGTMDAAIKLKMKPKKLEIQNKSEKASSKHQGISKHQKENGILRWLHASFAKPEMLIAGRMVEQDTWIASTFACDILGCGEAAY
jgi:hypothetical protein